MSFGAEVKVRRERVLEQLDQQIAGEQQRHRSQHGFRSGVAPRASASPDADGLGKDLDKDCREHEAGAESHEVFEEPLAQPVTPDFTSTRPPTTLAPAASNPNRRIDIIVGASL